MAMAGVSEMALWTPADITTALWLDAADSSTLFDATSGGSAVAADGAVARWEDKSGNVRHVTQSGSTARPQRKTLVQNSKDVCRFDGSNDIMIGDLTSSISQPVSVFFVTRKNANPASANGRVFYASTSNASEAGVFLPAAVLSTGGFVWNFGTSIHASAAFGTSWATYETLANGASSLIRRDASDVVTGDPENPGTNAIGRYFSIGGRHHDGLRNYNGDIGELVIVASTSTDTRQAVEGYLAHKWGLAGSLPSDHPYKSSAPTTGTIQTRRRRDLGGYGL